MDRIDLERLSEGTIGNALYGLKKYDPAALRYAVEESVGEDAANACIYTRNCLQIIDDYEREYGTDAEDLCGEATYAAGQWVEAMTSYAQAIAMTAMGQMTSAVLDEIHEAAEEVAELADCGVTDLVVDADCPHGWAPHDREDEAGTHFWEPDELEGCKAIARQIRGVWLSYTWTPAT